MANIIVEYKMDKNFEGAKIRPLWLDDGGYWYDKGNYTYVGLVKDPEVKVPDTVIRFTEKTFLERQLAIHKKYPLKKIDPDLKKPNRDLQKNMIDLTDEEVEVEVKNFFKRNKRL